MAMSQSATLLPPPIPSWARSLTTQVPCNLPNGEQADPGCSVNSCTPDNWWTRIATAIGLFALPNNITPGATSLGSPGFATLARPVSSTGVPMPYVLDDNLTRWIATVAKPNGCENGGYPWCAYVSDWRRCVSVTLLRGRHRVMKLLGVIFSLNAIAITMLGPRDAPPMDPARYRSRTEEGVYKGGQRSRNSLPLSTSSSLLKLLQHI
ncbi:hypothetical protein P170DRAFT_166178 [Aspergillus steynii IBT 23096]|uniref:Uncharacterized protein n=1 Tax=Aspergillus steynii IBT 23096 TaxID=1392250 RepID=A0A2I2G6W4_9EURO|nr:uncharacterized protein P170DRAFT_166178 [Aspergillus steynii IBT 23096]PLB48614.1 hypothetical protein P170DRAFT_166178 [Aspergillus steynii IBT 23096]